MSKLLLPMQRSDTPRGAYYKHINRLFTDTADWQLIETHWQDLMQVALSIQAGKISSTMVLLSSDPTAGAIGSALSCPKPFVIPSLNIGSQGIACTRHRRPTLPCP